MRYAFIPDRVYSDKSICTGAKLLFGEIAALCENNRSCKTSGAYLAQVLKEPEARIQDWLAQLQKGGHIRKELSINSEAALENPGSADEFVLYASFN